MLAFLIRRLVGGVVAVWFATFLSFSVLVEGPAAPKNQNVVRMHDNMLEELRTQWWYVDKPWPLNYVDWLLDPEAPDLERIWAIGLESSPRWREHTEVRGVLTGHLGFTQEIQAGAPVAEVIGPGWWLTHLAILTATLYWMAVVAVQRRDRLASLRTMRLVPAFSDLRYLRVTPFIG